MEKKTKLYGVATGNGNDGVSHMFPDYYVRTDSPWYLARVALLDTFKPGAGQAWAARHMETEGESEFTISAMLADPPCNDSADGEYPECENPEDAEDGRNWCEGNGAWNILEVFPVEESDVREGKMIYDSIESALRAETLAAFPIEKEES